MTDSKVLLGGLNIQDLYDMEATGSRGGSAGGSARGKGRVDTAEAMKRKVRIAPSSNNSPLQPSPQGGVLGDHGGQSPEHIANEGSVSATGSALTGDDGFPPPGTRLPWSIPPYMYMRILSLTLMLTLSLTLPL